jgi:outer membrane immunogenic protein
VDGKSSITGNSTSSSDSGLSFGVGAGFDVAPNMMIEAEYTLIEQDVDFISVGLNVKF